MPAGLDGHEVCCIRGHGATASGTQVGFEWKAWCSKDGTVRWEVRRPLNDFFKHVLGKSKLDVASYLSKQKDTFTVLLGKLGASFGDHIFPSRLAVQRAGNAEACANHMVKAEHTCTTLALLVILVWLSLARRVLKERELAKTLLLAFLGRATTPGKSWAESFDELLRERKPFCQEAPVSDGGCRHVVQLQQSLLAHPAAGSDKVLAILQQLQKCSTMGCEAISGLPAEFWDAVATGVDLQIAAGRFNVDARSLEPGQAAGQKRSRIDEDWKRMVVTESVQLKRARSGSMVLRAGGGSVNYRMAPVWEEKEMLYYQCAAHRCFKGCRQLSIASDGARLGDPPEENIIFIMWTPQGDVGAVAPPQAGHYKFHGAPVC